MGYMSDEPLHRRQYNRVQFRTIEFDLIEIVCVLCYGYCRLCNGSINSANGES